MTGETQSQHNELHKQIGYLTGLVEGVSSEMREHRREADERAKETFALIRDTRADVAGIIARQEGFRSDVREVKEDVVSVKNGQKELCDRVSTLEVAASTNEAITIKQRGARKFFYDAGKAAFGMLAAIAAAVTAWYGVIRLFFRGDG